MSRRKRGAASAAGAADGCLPDVRRTGAPNIRPMTSLLVQVLEKSGNFGGAEGDRTPDLRIANATLSQLSYGPYCDHAQEARCACDNGSSTRFLSSRVHREYRSGMICSGFVVNGGKDVRGSSTVRGTPPSRTTECALANGAVSRSACVSIGQGLWVALSRSLRDRRAAISGSGTAKARQRLDALQANRCFYAPTSVNQFQRLLLLHLYATEVW